MATRLVSSRCRGKVKWRSLGLCVAAVALLLAAAGSARGQQPDARLVASYGFAEEGTEPVWETAIAGGANYVMAVHHVRARGDGPKTGYALALPLEAIPPGDSGPSKPWIEEALVPLGEATNPHDPTVGWDSVAGDFVLCAQSSVSARAFAPFVAIYDSSERDFVELEPNQPGWKRVDVVNDPDPPRCEKPWLVAGEVVGGDPPHQEFYIVYGGIGQPYCLRSIDGGYTWYGSDIVPGEGPSANGAGFLYAAVHEGGPLYVSYQYDPDPNDPEQDDYEKVFRFVRGDDPNDVNDPMTWAHLDADPGPDVVPLYVGLYADRVHMTKERYLPLPYRHFQVQAFPNVAADPVDPDVLYVVYHDVVQGYDPNDADVDVDVFLSRLERQADGTWEADPRVRVNDEDDPNALTPSDQFLPALTVTPGPPGEPSRIHVIFYDDRNYEDQIDTKYPDVLNPEARFDVFYAYSIDGGLNFTNEELYQRLPETAVDYTLEPPAPTAFELTDYIGISHRPTSSGTGYQVYTSFTGTHANDPTDHKTVIYSSRIAWPE
ncbi:MAG TPA: hypothetical protein VM487_20175 [Phycisphaerae bacterium]|nr:hypothetical protein [Phycisphaerae bacterium]